MSDQWLVELFPEFGELSEKEIREIKTFSIIWSLFEGRCLNFSASANAIEELIIALEEMNLLEFNDFLQYLEYFSDRYISDGKVNSKFNNLHLRKNDKPDLVRSVLLRETEKTSTIVTALVIIVYRYRNNFFHGIKWEYGFEDQLSNFQQSNNLLLRIIEIWLHR